MAQPPRRREYPIAPLRAASPGGWWARGLSAPTPWPDYRRGGGQRCPQPHLVFVLKQQIEITADQRGPRSNADAMARLEEELENLPGDPQLLFHRLIHIAQKRHQDATLAPGGLHRSGWCKVAKLFRS